MKKFLYGVILMTFPFPATAQNQTGLCEQTLGGLSLTDTRQSALAKIGNTFPYNINVNTASFLEYATYDSKNRSIQLRKLPQSGDSEVRFYASNGGPVFQPNNSNQASISPRPNTRIRLNTYLAMQSIYPLKWSEPLSSDARRVKGKLREWCDQNFDTIESAKAYLGIDNLGVISGIVSGCADGSWANIEINEKAKDQNGQEFICHYTMNIRTQPTDFSQGNVSLVVVQEELTSTAAKQAKLLRNAGQTNSPSNPSLGRGH